MSLKCLLQQFQPLPMFQTILSVNSMIPNSLSSICLLSSSHKSGQLDLDLPHSQPTQNKFIFPQKSSSFHITPYFFLIASSFSNLPESHLDLHLVSKFYRFLPQAFDFFFPTALTLIQLILLSVKCYKNILTFLSKSRLQNIHPQKAAKINLIKHNSNQDKQHAKKTHEKTKYK